MARLEKWQLISRNDCSGKPYQQLYGQVYGHPRANSANGELIDGHVVVTSRIADINWDTMTVTTQSGTIYELGEREK